MSSHYTKGMVCVICETRKPRRSCPGVHGDICAICCGTEREVSISCPLDCEYLQEARRHEKPAPVDESAIPNREIEITERLLERNADLLNTVAASLTAAALHSSAIDTDVRDALAALARTFRTRESGVYYDTRPSGSYAAAIYDALQDTIREFREEEQRQGVTKTRDADVLAVVVFLERAALGWNNGRPRGRGYVDYLRRYYGDSPDAGTEGRSSLLLA